MSGQSRDVGIKVAVTSDVQGAAQIEAAFARLAPMIAAAMVKAQAAADAVEKPLARVSETAKKSELSLKGVASGLDGILSKIPGADVLGKPFSQGAEMIGKMGSQVTGLVSKIPGLSGLASALGPVAPILGPIAIGLGIVTAGVVGLTAVSLKLGAESSAAYATIAQKTGGTGVQLQSLETNIRRLANTSTQSMGEVASGLAMVSARTGQTGPALEGLTKQLMQLSKVTGTDMSANVANTTRMFGDWGIATDKQSEALDKLYKASQLTGAGTDQLSQKIVAYGAPLRQLGFSYEQSLAMLGKWEKEGVNTELVLGSMKKAVGALAEANIPLDGGFVALRDKIKAAGSDMEAFGIAKAAVGIRGASDLSAAVREGRFDFMELQKGIEGGSGAIKNAAAQSAGLGGQFKLMGNAAKAGLAPLTDAVFDIATKLVQQAVPAVQAFWSNIGDKLAPLAIRAKDALIPLIEKIGPVLTSAVTGVLPHLTNIGTLFGTVLIMMKPVADFVQANLQPILLTLAGVGIGAVIAAAVIAGPILMGLAASAWAVVAPVLAAAAPFVLLGAAVGLAVGYIVTHWEELKVSLQAAGAWVKEALDTVVATVIGWKDTVVATVHDLVEAAKMKVTSLWASLVGLFTGGVASVMDVARTLWDGLLTTWESIRVAVSGTVSGLWAWLQETWTNGVAFVSGVISGLAENMRAAWTWISTTVSGLVARLINWLRTSWGTAGTWLSGLLTRVANMFKAAWAWIRETVGGIVTRLVNAVVGALRWLGEKAAIIWERVQDLFSDAWTGIMGIFKGAAGGLVRGVGALFSKIAELAGKGMAAVGGVISRIFTAIVDKVKGLLGALGVDLGSIFTFGGGDDGPGFFENLTSGFTSGIQALMGGIGSIMAWFEAKWDGAKKKLQGFFAEKDDLKEEAKKDDPSYAGQDPGAGSGTDISGLAGGGSASAAKSYTAPDGMSGRESDGSEWYIDPATGKKIYTSGPKKNQQDARERGADAKAAAKGAKASKGSAAGGEDDPAVSAAKTAADTAARISEALQKAAGTLRELGRTELPGESVWGPKIAALGSSSRRFPSP
jgi:phage-related minor tail protein